MSQVSYLVCVLTAIALCANHHAAGPEFWMHPELPEDAKRAAAKHKKASTSSTPVETLRYWKDQLARGSKTNYPAPAIFGLGTAQSGLIAYLQKYSMPQVSKVKSTLDVVQDTQPYMSV